MNTCSFCYFSYIYNKAIIMKRKTKEQFIEEAKKIHGDKYDYSLVVYEGTDKKVKIICPIHGVFEQLPREHLHGHGCQLCAKSLYKSKKDEFIEKAKKIHGDKYDYSKVEYNGYHNKVCIICPEHGEFWKTPAKHISSKQGCPNCTKKHSTIPNFNSYTTEEWIKKAKSVHGDKYNYSKVEYVNSKTKVCIICPKHGEFWQYPSYHLNGNGCRKCADEKLLKTQEEFIKKCRETYGDKYDYSKVKYINSHTKVCIICPKHGEFYVIPKNFIRNQKNEHTRACLECALEERTKTTEEFIKEAKKIHGNKYDYSKIEYNGKNHKVCVICPKHGEFWQYPYNHLRGNCCPHCSAEINVYETKLFDSLNKDFPELEFIHSYKNKKILNRLELDIFSEKYKLAVEYQGDQHYRPLDIYGGESSFKKQKERDTLKKKICENNGILLLEFSYNKNEKQDNLITDYYELKMKIKKWLGNS